MEAMNTRKTINEIEAVKPEEVFSYFREICAIPHGSGNTR